MGKPSFLPRFLRATHEAPAYLSMSRDEFNKTVRPFVREFPIGDRGVGFDREELDAWADAYVEQAAIEKKGVTGQQSARSERRTGVKPWREKRSQVSRKETGSGTSIKRSTEYDFMKALESVTGKKPSVI
ncbi:hypothetical protein ACVA51_11015 [Pseudomonas luteola]